MFTKISRPKNLGKFHSNAMVANDATVKITGSLGFALETKPTEGMSY